MANSRPAPDPVKGSGDLTVGTLPAEPSAALLAALGAVAPINLYLYDLVRGATVWANRPLPVLLGYGPDGLPPSSFDQLRALTHPDDWAGLKAHFAALRTLPDGERLRCVCRLRRADGTWAWISGEAMVFERDEQGMPIRIVGSSSDITAERESAEALLREQAAARHAAATTDLAVRTARAFMFEWHIATDRVHRRPAGGPLPPTPPEGERLQDFLGHVHPDDLAAMHQIIVGARAHPGQRYELTYRVRDAEGGERWLHEAGFAEADESGEACRMLGVTSDITDHIVTRNRLIDSEHQLRRSMDELEQLYVRAPLGLGLLDRELRFVRINDALAEMNGFPAAEHIGKAVWDLLPDMRSSAEPALRQVVATGKILRDFEISGVTAARPGEVRHWREQFYPLRGDDGTVLGIGIICEEVTERKRQDQALRDSEGHLRALNEQLEKRVEEEIGRREAALAALHQSQKLDALGQLTAGIAHDFNNLVAAMAGGFSLVQRWTRNDERVQEVARQGLIAAGRGADLVKHLLAFARKQHLAPRRVNLADLLEEAEPLLRQSTGSRISVRIACPEVCPDVEVDVAQLETALMNLAINARDAMPDGGVLDITVAEPEPGIAAIVVRDRGGGMPADVLDRAREPFFTTKQPGKGTGLGLAMVHGFAEQSGGSLRITSEPGEGTTVELRLPSAGPAEAALAPAAAEAGRDSAAIRSILLVDDDDLVRTMTCRQLQELGYEVLAVPGAKAALAALDGGRRFDLMLCDVVMPGEDGPSLVARVRGRPAAPRVIFMTGHADRRRLTGERVLEKPFSLDQLIEAIGTA